MVHSISVQLSSLHLMLSLAQCVTRGYICVLVLEMSFVHRQTISFVMLGQTICQIVTAGEVHSITFICL